MITTLTAAGREYLTKHHGMPAGASLDQARALVGELVATGKMTTEQVKQLGGSQPADDVKNEVQKMITKAVADAMKSTGAGGGNQQTTPKGGLGHIMTDTTIDIRVKNPSERYLTTKSLAKHAKTGEPVTLAGTPVYGPSQLELAKIGVYFKNHLRNNAAHLSRAGLPIPSLSEHEENLLKEMQANDRWYGRTAEGNEVAGKTLAELNVKALLNDATSGGQYLVPEAFDEAVVTFPLLHSELLPLVDLKTTNRDTVTSATIGNPTVTWNTAEGTGLNPFTTTSLVGQISASVFPVAVAIEIGRDFLADSPVDVGATLAEIIGQVFAKELDDVIAAGDGTTQPEGILTNSGVTTVNSDNGSTGPWTLDDIEALLFAVPKQYRTAAMNCVFLTNDVTYSRWRGLSVSTSDARRLFGMDHEAYTTFARPHKINGDVANTQAAFVALKKYRLWRRAGVELLFETGGKTLALANTALMVARGRYAGELVDGSACAVIDDGQS